MGEYCCCHACTTGAGVRWCAVKMAGAGERERGGVRITRRGRAEGLGRRRSTTYGRADAHAWAGLAAVGVDVGAVEIYQNVLLDRQRGVKRVQRERGTNALARVRSCSWAWSRYCDRKSYDWKSSARALLGTTACGSVRDFGVWVCVNRGCVRVYVLSQGRPGGGCREP